MDGEDSVSLADADRILDDKRRAHPVLLDDPGAVEGLDEDLARAVATGTLAGVDVDQRVVDPEARQRGHNMLDHLDGDTVAADRCATLGRYDRIDPSGDRRPTVQVAAPEDNPGVGLGRVETNRHVVAMEESDSAHLRRAGDRTLLTGRSEHSLPLRLILDRARAPAPWLSKATRPRRTRPRLLPQVGRVERVFRLLARHPRSGP